jgi:2-oxoglutarate ferredoxin oxidoreductase subunit alpha
MDAGFGAQKAGDILIRAFAADGKNVFIEPMIPAEISPPPRTREALSGAIIRVAAFDINNIGNDTNLILASHEILLDTRLDDEEFDPNGRVILNVGHRKTAADAYARVARRIADSGGEITEIEIIDYAASIIGTLDGAGKNMYYLGILAFVYSIETLFVAREIRKAFPKLSGEKLDKNVEIFEIGYDYASRMIPVRYDIPGGSRQNDQKILIDGNGALSMGIIDAGIKFMSGYPITPASSIMHTLAKELPSYGGTVHQAEDEIAAIGAAIGAYFGGTPSITCTSGPGLSLKQEFIGYAAVAEIPLIVVDAQRSGPSTGMPTKTEQSDLTAAVFGRHGDNTAIVISVADVVDCFYAPHVARHLTEKLKIPVLIMSDFQTANSYNAVDKMAVAVMEDSDAIADHILEHFYLGRLPDDIEMVKTEQAVPGTEGGMRRVTGLNTDQTGAISYYPKSNHRAHAVRNAKIHHVRRALKTPEIFGAEKADLLVVGWGSARGVIEEAVSMARADGLSVSGMHFKFVYPLPLHLTDIFDGFKQIITVELAYGDILKPPPLATLLRMETLRKIQSPLSQASGRPMSPNSVLGAIQECLSKHDEIPQG